MPKKLTIEEIRNRVKELPIELLSTEYKDVDSILQWKHKDCNHTFPRRFGKIKQTSKCPICNGQEYITIEVINRRLKEGNIPVSLISTECDGAKGIVTWECHKEGHRWDISPDGFFTNNKEDKINKRSYGCRACANKNRESASIDEIKGRIKDKPIMLVSLEVPNVKSYVDWKCKKHDYVFSMTPDNVYQQDKFYCPQCELDKIREELISTKRDIKLLSTEYTGRVRDRLLWKCLLTDCNHIWPATRVAVLGQGSGCPNCHHITQNKTNAIRNKDKWSKIPSVVYFLHCSNNNEEFYKIGITTQHINKRMYKIPYTCKVVKTIKTNKYDAVFIEADYLYKHKKYQYEPAKFFGGYRECFTELILD